MEYVGFILFLIGAGSMDSNGVWFYVAAGLTIFGLLLMYTGEVIKDRTRWKRKSSFYKEER